MKNKRGYKIFVFFVCIVLVSITAFIGSTYTGNETNSQWYNQTKSSITPPNWVFPIAWTILFFLLALAMYYTWTSKKTSQENKKRIALAFGSNLLLNIVWSPFFFYFKNPVMAFVDLIFLWLSIITIMLITQKLSKKSFYLMIPYLVWVTFAGILNLMAI